MERPRWTGLTAVRTMVFASWGFFCFPHSFSLCQLEFCKEQLSLLCIFFNGFGRLFISVWTHGYLSYSLSYPARTVFTALLQLVPLGRQELHVGSVSSDTPHPFCSASSMAAQDGPGSSCVFCLSCGIRHFFMEPWLLFMVIKLIFNRRAKAIQRGKKCIFSKWCWKN